MSYLALFFSDLLYRRWKFFSLVIYKTRREMVERFVKY